MILRLYGHGQSINRQESAWAELEPLFPQALGNRNIILMEVESVQTSCGFAVPLFEYQADRDLLTKWTENRGEAGLQRYWAEKNQVSIDGLPTYLLENK